MNSLLESAHRCYDGGGDSEWDVLRESLSFAIDFRRQVIARYRESLKIRPPTPLLRSLESEVAKKFSDWKKGLQLFEDSVRKKDRSILPRASKAVKSAVEDLMRLMDRLREEEESFPIYSPSPRVHEIVHLAIGVRKGYIDERLLKDRIDRFMKDWAKFCEDYREWLSLPVESERVKELLPKVEMALNYLGSGIKQLAGYFQTKRDQVLREGCEVILRATDALVRLQEMIFDAAAPEKICPRCSSSNPTSAKICANCSAQLPVVVDGMSNTFNIVSHENERSRRLPYVVKVESAVESFMLGDLSLDELQRVVKWFRGRIEEGRRLLKQVSRPPSFPDAQAEKLYTASRKLLEKSAEKFTWSITRLELFFERQELELLRQGVDALSEGERLLLESYDVMLGESGSLNKPTGQG